MEQYCTSKSCRQKLSVYRESTSKQYETIDGLEDDIKEKDLFLQKVVQQRNQFQEEVHILKKKNSELLKESDNLIEKVNQLEEDTDIGLERLEMAHDKERKLKEELEKVSLDVVKEN